jgi:serine/threonine-protein kinase
MEGKELDSRSDIYSLGVVMFEMLTGKMPIQPSAHSFGAWYKAHHSQEPRSFSTVAPKLQLPQEVENLVMSCLAKSPSDRPQSISEILKVLISLEQRYGKIVPPPEAPRDTPPLQPKLDRSLSSAEIALLSSWPKNKPIADIVFPHPIRANNGEFSAALWVMLPEQEIQKRLACTRYNQFLFITSPHPMLLWITVIHNREHGAKWLPYYLDLKTPHGQEITRLLGETGEYRLLFFARESPQRCAHVMLSTIAPTQRKRLQQWAIISQTLVSTADPLISKRLLKSEYEKIKPQILMKLEAIHGDSSFDLSG